MIRRTFSLLVHEQIRAELQQLTRPHLVLRPEYAQQTWSLCLRKDIINLLESVQKRVTNPLDSIANVNKNFEQMTRASK